MSNGSGTAVNALGLHPDPLGTPDELRKEGLSLTLVGSCAPPDKMTRTLGCQYYEQCIFRYRKNGGFRDAGPKNIGYFHQTHEGTQIENEGSCHFFMARLYDRQWAGERDRRDGLNGEIIEIIAQEGETIHKRVIVNVNAPPYVEKAGPPEYKKTTITGPVKRFLRPGEREAIDYDTLVSDRRRLRVAQDDERAEGAPVHRVQPAKAAAEPEPIVVNLDEVVAEPVAEAAPVAAPVARKAKP